MSYQFVPIPDRVKQSSYQHSNRHDRRLEGALFGYVELTYLCKQPIHVGSGFKRLEAGKPVRAMTQSGETLIIPGSSFKGVLRARYEAMTHSCGLFRLKDGKTQSRSEPDIKRARLAPGVANHPVQKACRKERGCPACTLFGMMSSRSRVALSDFSPTEPVEPLIVRLPEQYGPRLHHVGQSHVDRSAATFVVTKLDGRKFYRGQAGSGTLMADALPKGTLVSGKLRVFNVQPAEMGGLLTAAGFLPSSLLKLGAGKGVGFGLLQPAAINWFLKSNRRQPLPQNPPEWRTLFEQSADRWATGEVALLRLHGAG